MTDNFAYYWYYAFAYYRKLWQLLGWKLWRLLGAFSKPCQLSHSKTLATFRLIFSHCLFFSHLPLFSYPQSYPHIHRKKLFFANIPYFAKSYPHIHTLPLLYSFVLSLLFLHLLASFELYHLNRFIWCLLRSYMFNW